MPKIKGNHKCGKVNESFNISQKDVDRISSKMSGLFKKYLVCDTQSERIELVWNAFADEPDNIKAYAIFGFIHAATKADMQMEGIAELMKAGIGGKEGKLNEECKSGKKEKKDNTPQMAYR
jgi:hypothetical protein